MKTRILTQAQKQHSPNRLHDAFIAAEIAPIHVESVETETRFRFEDTVGDNEIDAVIAAYTFAALPAPIDIRVAWQNYKNGITAASTVAQIKSALTNDLGVLLKEILKTRDDGLT